MPIYKNGNDFKIAKSDEIFDLAADNDVATEQEMKKLYTSNVSCEYYS